MSRQVPRALAFQALRAGAHVSAVTRRLVCGLEGQPSPLGGLEGAEARNEEHFLSRSPTGTAAAVRRSFGFLKRPPWRKGCSVPVVARLRDRRHVYRPEEIPSLPDSLVLDERWKLAIRQRWAHAEHINALELRVAVSAVQRAARDSRFLGKRLLLLSDNMVTVCLLEKGRSRIRILTDCAARQPPSCSPPASTFGFDTWRPTGTLPMDLPGCRGSGGTPRASQK